MKTVTFSIPNWQKYNPRADRANHSWFRFQNGFFQDHKLFGMTDSQILLFIFLMCEFSKNGKPECEVNLTLVAALRREAPEKILNDFKELSKIGAIVTSSCRHDDVIEPAKSLTTNERTNERTDLSSGDDPPSLFQPPEIQEHPLVKIWNENRGPLPKVIELNPARQKSCTARWKECKDAGQWTKVAKWLSTSKFHTGQNDRAWRANFDYFLKPNTRIEIIEKITHSPNQGSGGQWI